MKKTIVWLRQDLRMHDNDALYHAALNGDEVIPLFILDENETIGSASKLWLFHSLKSLKKDFEKQHVKLIIKKGKPTKILNNLLEDSEAQALYFNEVFTPYAQNLEKDVKERFLQIKIKTFNSSLLFHPQKIKNLQGNYFKIFTPFYKACLKSMPDFKILPNPKLPKSTTKIASLQIEELDLHPDHNWTKSLEKAWNISEEAALKKLDYFFENNLNDYANGRDIPSKGSTSYLSPYLHFGQISPRLIYNRANFIMEVDDRAATKHNIQKFLAELIWREFSYYLLYHFPNLATQAFKAEFNDFAWLDDKKTLKEQLKQWQKGQTGYPIVDAGMRQLWREGYMHNRVRMIVASFLTKHLLIPWQIGADWFMDCLFDADIASNSANWQWVAGCGSDAAPYFRIFNPILQSEKFDPSGDYVRKYVPELKNLPTPFIHKPWQASKEILKSAKIELEKTYPRPIIDHDFARARALNAYKKLKK